jgi:hypothetical protein
MRRFAISRAASFLYDSGVRFHAFGILRDSATGAALYDFYKVDFLTDAQKAAILAACPGACFRGAFAEFAPELRGVYICFPKAAMQRRLQAGKGHAA